MIEKLKTNRFINVLALIGVFIFTERSMREMFLLVCSYRMMTIHTIMTIGCSWLVILLFFYKLISGKLITKNGELWPLVWYLAIFAAYLVSTLVNGGSISRWADDLIFSFAAIALLLIVDNKKTLFSVASWIFLILAALNILCEYVSPLRNYMSQWRKDYFLGFQNAMGWTLLLGMLFALLDYKQNGNKVKLIAYIVIFYANQIMCFCATAVVGSMIIALYLIFPFVRKIFEKWKFPVLLLFVIALFFVLVVFYGKVYELEPIRLIVEKVFGKDATLSGRLYVWQGILPEALKKPILGHGFAEKTNYFYETSKWNHGLVHAHNEWLQCMYEGGFVTLAVGMAMIVFCSLKIKSKECKLILFTLLVMLQADIIAYYPWYLITFVLEVGFIEKRE